MTFRIGVIGAGGHGTRYLRHAANDVEGMGAAALCRRDAGQAAALADELGVTAHTDPSALIADPAVDGVVVCTPPSSHFDLAAAVLAAGKPLLLEKPMTGTLEEARRLETLDRTASPPLMLAQSLRWNPVIRKVRDLWPQLGRVHLVRAAQRLEPTTLAWQRNIEETVGGSVLLTGVHIFDTVRFLTGREFIEIDSRQRQILNPAVEDLFLARGRLDDGCLVDMEVSKYTRSRACWLEAVGEDAQLWADYLRGGIVIRSGREERHYDVSAAVPTLPPLLADWLRSVRDGSRPPVDAADGVATLRIVEACYRSAADQESVAC